VTVGVIGAGTFAKSVLLPRLKAISGVELATICTATGLSARHAAEKFGFAVCTTDADTIFNDPAINTVVIATRHNLHAPLVVKALQAGKHVFVEKPLALNEDELCSIAGTFNACPEQGRRGQSSNVLTVGFNRRFAPFTQQVKQFFTARSEPLAIHYRVNAGYVPPDHWVHDPEEGGGRIVGEVCHFVDWMQYLVGEPPVQVYGKALPADDRYPAEDNALITLAFADGSAGTIHYLANGDSRLPKEYIEIFGGGAVAIIEDFRRGWLVQHGRRTRLGRRFGPQQDKGHTAELQAFITAVREGGPSPIPFEDAVSATLATFRIRESLRAGTPVEVRLDEIEK
jgi:polar amino acid transport system substrate-binding protein